MNVETLWPDIELEARRLGVEAAALAAIVAVESGGQVTARVNGREEPLIRFEGHWFDRRLAGTMREQARRLGLASPRAGAVKNPISQAARWGLLGRAIDIDRAAALESTSWGIGQVMGGNWKMLGYESVEALVAEARSGPAGQLRLMANFLVSAGIVPALRRREWKAVARVYNGPAFAANAYDQKLASAYTRYAGHAAAPQPASDRPAGRVLLRRRARRGHRLVAAQPFRARFPGRRRWHLRPGDNRRRQGVPESAPPSGRRHRRTAHPLRGFRSAGGRDCPSPLAPVCRLVPPPVFIHMSQRLDSSNAWRYSQFNRLKSVVR